jgi:hypothetical protein
MLALKHAALVLALCSMGPGARATDRNWSQPRGNAEGTCVSTVAPVRALPVEEWRVEFDALVAGPVSWGDVVYVVAEKGREYKLCAFDVRGGAPLGTQRITRVEDPELAVWQGTVVVCSSDAVRTFVHKKDRFQLGKSLEGAWIGAPAIDDGLLFLGSASHVFCIDLKRLEIVASCAGGFGRPAVVHAGSELQVATQSVHEVEGYEGEYLHLERAVLKRVKGSFELESKRSRMLGVVSGSGDRARSYCATVAGPPTSDEVWFLFSGRPLAAQDSREGFHCALTTGNVAPVVTDVAVDGDSIFGFDADGTLIRFRSDGKYEHVVAPDALPAGARPGAATIASGVLYLGNWAVDLATRRVLWCDPELTPDGALVPVSDGRLVYTRGQALIGLVDPTLGTPAPTASTAAKVPDAASALARPGRGEALVLADGDCVAGSIERIASDRVRCGELEVPLADVALIESASGVELRGEPYSVFRAFERALDAEYVEGLAGLFERYATGGHVEDARRLLAEARAHGLAPERGRELEGSLSGKAQTQRANAGAQRARLSAEEDEARGRIVVSFLEAADWCERAGLGDVAAGILARAADVQPAGDASEILARAVRTMPAAFPWERTETNARLWLHWAREILPAGATFLAADDPLWKRARNEPWSASGTLALRTRNLLLFSRAEDPEILGSCLRRAEGTLRVLGELLDVDPAVTATPLDVRLHATRDAYLAECTPDGFYAMAWTSGYYSPEEKVSRFYAPSGRNDAALERELHLVVAHELVHHFLDERWIPGVRNPNLPGFWMVEGFARFAEDQVLELGRARRSFDDPTVLSLDVASKLWKEGILLDTENLLLATQIGFHTLSPEPVGAIQLRNTLAIVQVSQAILFYEQAGSLVYFLVNRRGDAGRAAFLGLMRDYYRGKPRMEPWKMLGFESAAELDQEFKAFLEELVR